MELKNGENAFKRSTDAQLKRIKSTTTFRPVAKPVVTNDEKFKRHDSLLFISQIDASVQEHKLRNLFSPYAEVLGLRLISKENNRKFCFMNVRDQKQAEKIISTFDGYSLNGQNIRISYSREKKAVPAANMNQDVLNEASIPSKFYKNEHSPLSPIASKFYENKESPPSSKASKFYKWDPPQPAWTSMASSFYLDDSRVSPPNPNLSKFHVDDPKISELREKDIQNPVDLEDVCSVNIANFQFEPQNNIGSNLSSDVNCGMGVLNFQNLEKPEYFDIDFDRNCVVIPFKEYEPVVTNPETEEPENNVFYIENIEYVDNSVDFNVSNRDCGIFSIVSDTKNTLSYGNCEKVVDTQDNLFHGNSENAKDPCTEFSETCGVVNFYNCESEESFSSNGSFRYRPVDFDSEFDNNISPIHIDSLHQPNNVEGADFGYNFRQAVGDNGCVPFQYTFNDDDAPNVDDLNFLNEDDIPNNDDWGCA